MLVPVTVTIAALALLSGCSGSLIVKYTPDDTGVSEHPDDTSRPDDSGQPSDDSEEDSGIVIGSPNEDDDRDGFSEIEGDCNDFDARAYPGAEEIWYDGIDQNCDGASDYDMDGDGEDSFARFQPNGTDCDDDGDGEYVNHCENRNWDVYEDCDDGNPLIYPERSEDNTDIYDNNCNGVQWFSLTVQWTAETLTFTVTDDAPRHLYLYGGHRDTLNLLQPVVPVASDVEVVTIDPECARSDASCTDLMAEDVSVYIYRSDTPGGFSTFHPENFDCVKWGPGAETFSEGRFGIGPCVYLEPTEMVTDGLGNYYWDGLATQN